MLAYVHLFVCLIIYSYLFTWLFICMFVDLDATFIFSLESKNLLLANKHVNNCLFICLHPVVPFYLNRLQQCKHLTTLMLTLLRELLIYFRKLLALSYILTFY